MTPAATSASWSSRPKSLPGGRGLRCIVPLEPGSRASATAGSPSVTRLTVNTWTTLIGTPIPASTVIAKSTTSPRLAESKNATNLRTLSPIRRPSSIAATIVAKSSSVSTISAASRAASVPEQPIAMPTSARRSAGVSLTPSPVTATTSPLR